MAAVTLTAPSAPRGGRPPGSRPGRDPWREVDKSWMDDAACANASIEVRRLFFTDADRSVTAGLAVLEAKAICAECPVQPECLDAAFEGNMHGIWGGTTRKEREKIRKLRRRQAR